VQLDVGYGDAVTPGPEEIVHSTLLAELPSPKLKVYPRASVVAEKLEAIGRSGVHGSVHSSIQALTELPLRELRRPL
jgi:hypothetical protein